MLRILRVVVLLALPVAVSLVAAISWAGMIGQQQAGIAVDAQGVLSKRTFNDPGNALTNERIAAAKVALRNNVGRPSPLRKVSLNRLQAAIDELLEDNRQITAEMKNMAGLTRITHVFFYPELGEIVIAGPAEGWFEDLSGRVRGMETGLPTCQLQNLLVALRAYPPGKQGADLVGCSIDPTAEGLRRMQDYLRRVRPRSPADGPAIAKGLCESLGMQNISVLGVPADTQFAHIMVEADYRMKLIGIGLEKPAVAFKNYVERASAAQVSQNAMQRWYFVPDYQCVRMSEDRLAMELVGEGVKLIGEDELVTGEGQRQKNTKVNLASKAFVETFTKKYPELAAQSPVFAQLRVLIDMLVVAAHIQQEDYYGKARWQPKTLLDEEKLPVRVVNPAKQVETAANAIMKGNRLLTPVGGGVEIRAREAFDSKNRLRDDGGRVQSQRAEVSPKGLAKGQWWWD
jgi:hypothetical protein